MFGKKREFKLKGNRSFLRTDEGMRLIDKVEADSAFKSCKKQYLDSLLKEKGFAKFKTNGYVRRNQADVLEYIELQKEKNGSRTFTVNYAVTPLYIHYDYPLFCFSDRIGMLICEEDVWWDYADNGIASVSFENVADAIEEFVLPWFEAHSNDDSIKLLLSKQRPLSIYMQAWLESLENRDNCQTIKENIKLFGLPKRLDW
jgi:hypothetical protein